MANFDMIAFQVYCVSDTPLLFRNWTYHGGDWHTRGQYVQLKDFRWVRLERIDRYKLQLKAAQLNEECDYINWYAEESSRSLLQRNNLTITIPWSSWILTKLGLTTPHSNGDGCIEVMSNIVPLSRLPLMTMSHNENYRRRFADIKPFKTCHFPDEVQQIVFAFATPFPDVSKKKKRFGTWNYESPEHKRIMQLWLRSMFSILVLLMLGYLLCQLWVWTMNFLGWINSIFR